jgi:two-component system cell cycle sensor histidine kinase/response regulator CckA
MNAEQVYRALMDQAHLAIGIADGGGFLVEASRALEQLAGSARSELIGRHLSELCAPEERAACRALLAGGSDGDAPRQPARLRLVDAQERRIPVELSLSRADNGAGAPLLLALFSDASERERLETQLRQIQPIEAVSRLSARVAHDFNNLLNVIVSSCDLLLDGLPPEDRRHQEATDARVAAERVAALTRQLTGRGRKDIDRARPVAVNAAVAKIGRLLERVLGDGISHSRTLDAGAGAVRIDPTQLDEVLLSLAMHARSAMPEGGTLLVATAAIDSWVRLTVADDGVGPDESTRARRFESSLGWATTHAIVARNGGHIQVDGVTGGGSRIHVYLPRVDAEAEGRHVDDAAGARLEAARRTVLVVDDDDLVRNAIGRMLRRSVHEALLARSTEEAARLLATYPGRVDVLLVDVVLRGQSGEAAAQALTALRPEMQVVFMSGSVEHPYLQETPFCQPQQSFLSKPFTQAALLAKLHPASASAR